MDSERLKGGYMFAYLTDNWQLAKWYLRAFLSATLILGAFSLAWGEIDLEAIAKIESNNNPQAYNAKENACGLYQIRQPCLTDYNNAHSQKYALTEMFDPKKAYKVAYWYFNAALPRYLRNKGIPVTDTNLIIAYNWGIGKIATQWRDLGRIENIPLTTQRYLKKYAELTKKGDK
jgi:soluble lytic murein transglycosylase-like protein